MSLLDIENGARFYRCDLHIHSPKSECYRDKHVQAQDIVKSAIDKNIEIIAITDHNSEGLFLEVAEAAEGTSLFVIPGVEVTTSQGGYNQVHLLALFPPDKHGSVSDFLSRIGIPSDKRAKSDALSDQTIVNIMKEVHNFDGISILAHIDSPGGLDLEIEKLGPTKGNILKSEYLNGIEITQKETLSKYGDYACIQSSDAHSLSDIGARFCLIKMGEPSFEGLRQALHDPASRICLDEGDKQCYPMLLGMTVNGGFLSDQKIHFNKNLNCIIGGKGTGKSTVIELIRYCLNTQSTSDYIKSNEDSHIKYALNNGKVTLYVQAENGMVYRIERCLDEDPKTFTEDGNELNLNFRDFYNEFFRCETYSQNELLNIARNFQNQLMMIDQYVDLTDLEEREKIIQGSLSKNQMEIKDKTDSIGDLESKTAELDVIREKLRVFESRGVKQQLQDYTLWGNEETILNEIETLITTEVSNRQQLLEKFKENNLKAPQIEDLDRLPNKNIIEESLSHLKKTKVYIEEIIQKEIDCLIKCQKGLSNNKETWEARYGAKKEELRRLQNELEAQGVPIKDIEEYLKLEKKKTQLENLVLQINNDKTALLDLSSKREKLLEEFARTRNEFYGRRMTLIRKINSSLNGFVRISINKDGDNADYKDYLVSVVLSDKKKRISKDDRERIADNVSPSELCKFVTQNNIDLLAQKASISKEVAEKAIYLTQEEIYTLQTVRLEDKVTIELNDHSWKEISKCSDGQKCTAILAIAMYERDFPLIIDQPEDSLDNSFIYKNVVQILRQIKKNRQLLVVTHNPNIPVLGDAELIMVMKSNGQNGFVSERGVIDKNAIKSHVQSILEGGKEAFDMRMKKYGF